MFDETRWKRAFEVTGSHQSFSSGVILFTLLVLSIVSAFPEGGSAAETVRPQIGLWYTVWWTKDDQFHHWTNCHRFPVRGRYTVGDLNIIKADHAEFRRLGIDFLIMDDTNGVGADGKNLNNNIRAWFEFMDALPVSERIPICIGGGGEMRAAGKTGQLQADDYYWENWAQRPSYLSFLNKPLVLVETDKNYGPADFDDARFAVRWVYPGAKRVI
jgi:hypothetical protein